MPIMGVLITAAELAEVVDCSPSLDRHRLGRAERTMLAVLRVADHDVQDWGSIGRWVARSVRSRACRPAR